MTLPSAEQAQIEMQVPAPMEEAMEQDLWNSFAAGVRGGPADISTAPETGTDKAPALDDDRAKKWRRPDGKGEGKEWKGGRGGGGQPQHRSRTNHPTSGNRRKYDDFYTPWGGQEEWGGHDISKELERMRSEITMMRKLILRHEDAINIWRAACSFVLFVRAGIPASIIPGLVNAKTTWQKRREATPNQVTTPMRCALMACMIKETLERIGSLHAHATRRETLTKLGWMEGENFLTIRWDATTKKLIGDKEGPRLSITEASETIASIGAVCQNPEALCRFHPTRPIVDGMPEGTVCFLLQYNLMIEDGRVMYRAIEKLCSSGSTQLMGMEVRKERLGRSALAQQLSHI